MKKFVLFLLFFSVCFFTNAQNRSARANITSQYNQKSITSLKQRLVKAHKIDSLLIKAYVKEHKLDSVKAKRIVGITEGGKPLMIKNNSLPQINATNTKLVIENTTPGLNLSGDGITAYVFDEGQILTSHQEFESRVSNAANNTTLSASHPTNVAGVIAAKGISSSARGMANKISVIGETYLPTVSQLYQKITNAASAGAILSNHSYGFVVGWVNDEGFWRWHGDDNISTTEEYSFGYYGPEDKIVDEIVYNANYHTFVNASSNYNFTPTNGFGPGNNTNYFMGDSNTMFNTNSKPRNKNCSTGFDCIPTGSLGKNIITVGAVQSFNDYNNPADVKLSVYSGVGPADDGRIKPDLVSIGDDVTTTCESFNSCYDAVNGTSFSTPSVTGIIGLLQELYNSENSAYMRSDLVKALLIHSANEAGTTAGPDYKFGWGMVDAYKSANTILNNGNSTTMMESELLIDTVCTSEFEAPIGSNVKATIAWIDKPSNPVAYGPSALNNKTKRLVNDLDIRIVDNDNSTNIFSPWVLNVNSPSSPATKGDNSTDNVEQIEFTANNSSGKYTLYTTHKGVLSNTTKYALVLNKKIINSQCELIEKSELSAYFIHESQELFIKYPLANTTNSYQITVYDYFGKKIITKTSKDSSVSLKSLGLVLGTYIVLVESLGKKSTVKFFVR